MQAYRLEITITQDKTLTLRSLPFQAGELVEVIILPKAPAPSVPHDRYPLRGTPITYINPTEPVAQTDWEVMQ
jgi:hypothetical protein